MTYASSAQQSLRRVFQQAFVVHDIAEPLISFDHGAASQEVRQFMRDHRLEIVGVRRAGKVDGYVHLTELAGQHCGECLRPITGEQLVLDTTPLPELVRRLKDQRRLFVSVFGHPGGIVSRTDLQKPPVRMWLFGMVTLIEMRFNDLIARERPADAWQQFLSEGRLEKARGLLAERRRRNQELGLLDCLQLSDKAQIVARDETLRSRTRFQSRRKLEEAAKMLERLRNNLAHSQDIVTNDWSAIVALSENLESILDGPATPHTASDA